MNRSQQPKKGPRVWLPLVIALSLTVGGALLWWTGGHSVSQEGPETEVAPAQEQPTPPPPSTPPAVDAPTGKSRQPIFDRNMAPLAVSFKQASIYLKPIELQEGQKAVEHLSALLGLSADKIKTDLRTERGLFWLKRNLDAETARKIADSKYSGVYLVDELLRYYPFHDHAAHVVGFVKGEQGLAGAEFIYDTILSGERTLASQYLNLPGINTADLPATGAAAVVSVDIDLQIILEQKLQHLQQQTGAQSVSAVVVEAGSGEILAMANLPAYDPNLYWKAAVAAHENKILSAPVPMSGINAFLKAGAELAGGNLPPEMATREEEAERVISPRAIKISKSDVAIPATPESQVWQPGIHLSPPFQWPLKFTQTPEELASYCATLGVGGTGSGLGDTRLEGGEGKPANGATCPLEDDTARAYPLQLLAAFAQLTNGGNAIWPHLLRGVWLMEEETFLPSAFPVSKGIGPQASADFIGFMEGLRPPGPGEALILESIKSKVRLAEIALAKVREEEPSRSIEDALRFTSMALASGRQGEHQLALIIMVDGAKFNLALPSPVRKTAAEIISQAHSLLAKRWEGGIKTPHLDSDAVLYQQWSLAQATDAPVQSNRLITLEMPDLVGMSLRKAMQALQGYNLKVTIQGTGRVIRQAPAAGVRLTGIDEAKLELGMDKPL